MRREDSQQPQDDGRERAMIWKRVGGRTMCKRDEEGGTKERWKDGGRWRKMGSRSYMAKS